MKMKKLLGVLAVAVLAAWTCQAADYDNGHVYNVRQFRVALGSGTAPTSADMAKIRLHNGDQVLNTDDNVLYIMNATNVYTKISAAGAMTVSGTINGITLSTTTVTNVLAAGSVLPAVDASAVTNITAANIAASGTLPALNGAALTALASANLAGNIALARLTNALVTVGTYTNAQATFTNVFDAAGVLISHTP